MLSMVFVMITMSAASAKRVAEVLDEQSDLTNGEDPVMEVRDGSVKFDHVSFAYKKDGEKALEDIDLDIKSGETIGIIGGTGSAKSSLVQLLPRLYDVTEGSVTIGGVDVRRYDLDTCATTSPWCCRRTSCSAARSPRTCAGATPTPPTPRSRTLQAGLRR